MARKLTPTEATWYRPVIHDIFAAGGLIKKSLRTYSSNYVASYNKSSAELICNEIKHRTFEFHNTDRALERIATFSFYPLHEAGRGKTLTANQIANIIANFCAEHEIFWDDVNTLRTSVEMDTYRMSALGRACWERECFLSQQSAKAAKASKAGSSARSASRGDAPKSGYKSSGPKSGLVKGLVGKPGDKTLIPRSDVLFVIVCNSTKTKKQYVYVSPLVSNKVKLGDPSGYSDCKLFFKSLPEAKAAVELLSGRLRPDHITGFTLQKQSADPNGYFEIETDIGRAYIKASKLNETLEEARLEAPTAAVSSERKSRFPEINDIDVYYEAMQYHE
jgi:hypothetical protein